MTGFGKAFVISLIGIALIGILYPKLAEASNGAPTIPHSVTGQEKCLICHSPEGSNPVPSNHIAYNEDTCLVCHSASTSGTTAEKPLTEESCQQCHSQSDLKMTLPNGETIPLFIDAQKYSSSVHGDKLLCNDCHSAISGYPHPKREVSSRREYNIAQYELCKKCHFDNYTKTLDSIHYEVLSQGNLSAPLCTNCHGAHDVTEPSKPRTKISQTCSWCHQDVYQEYTNSVHGKVLTGENNIDVPVCTDCHQAHSIENPTTTAFRLQSVELCSGCHGNKEMMQKYGISTNVVKSYLEDFHGRSVALIGEEGKDIPVNEAVCTDCHGVHNIQKVDDPDSSVIKANLLDTCRKCHPDATTNFPGAWLSHYEPGLTKTPVIFFVRWFYWIMIPFMLAGLSVHVLLDLWRNITNR